MTTDRAPRLHWYSSTGEAYDSSQSSDEVAPGDLLAVLSEGVVGILVDAWPTAVGDMTGEFHALAEGITWAELDGGKYAEAARVARDLLARFDLPDERGRFMIDAGEFVTCLDGPQGCDGPVRFMTTPDRDDLRHFPRCEAHGERRLIEAERNRELLSDVPPSGFDPSYAGESWGDDY